MARDCVLDWFGIAVAGANEPLVHKLIAEAQDQGGKPETTVLWHGVRTSPMFVALINGSAGDALDFADSNFAMRGHTTPGVVACSLAMAEWRKSSGLDFLKAVIAGIETECRVGTLMSPGFLRKGFHPTGTTAPFGCAGAASYLLGLDIPHTAHALGIVATQAAGLLASGGTMSKPFHSGKAAMNGLLAAKLSQRDFIARPDAIEAPEGFLETHANGRNVEALVEAGKKFFIFGTRFKSHAACQLTHSTIENMLLLKNQEKVKPEDVEHIDVQVPPGFLSVCNIQEPQTGLQGKFSLRVTAAMTLLGDDTMDIGAYTAERVTRPELVRLRDRVAVKGNPELSGGIAIATVTLKDGRTLTKTSDAYEPIGSLALQRRMVTRKFHALLDPILGKAAAEKLRDAILTIDTGASVAPLLAHAAKV
jgi:2-methylcitrate dehydratase PrpD